MKNNIPYLKSGDTIGIVAPAYRISREEILPTIGLLNEAGFQVELGQHLFSSDNQFSGSDQDRIFDFQKMLDDPDIKAILCARGGYGCVRIIDQLDFTTFKKSPKWICGYSDITVFHSHIFSHFHLPTVHCTMPVNISSTDTLHSGHIKSLINALRGDPLHYTTTNTHPFNRSGIGEGRIIGGNLSILYSLLGSPSNIDTKGVILFIEDVDEYLYHIDRMMMNMKRNGMLEKLSGLIVGGMTKMHKNRIYFGKTAEEIVADHCRAYHYPICFHFPAGHIKQNMAIRFGQKAEMRVGSVCEILIQG